MKKLFAIVLILTSVIGWAQVDSVELYEIDQKDYDLVTDVDPVEHLDFHEFKDSLQAHRLLLNDAKLFLNDTAYKSGDLNGLLFDYLNGNLGGSSGYTNSQIDSAFTYHQGVLEDTAQAIRATIASVISDIALKADQSSLQDTATDLRSSITLKADQSSLNDTASAIRSALANFSPADDANEISGSYTLTDADEGDLVWSGGSDTTTVTVLNTLNWSNKTTITYIEAYSGYQKIVPGANTYLKDLSGNLVSEVVTTGTALRRISADTFRVFSKNTVAPSQVPSSGNVAIGTTRNLTADDFGITAGQVNAHSNITLTLPAITPAEGEKLELNVFNSTIITLDASAVTLVDEEGTTISPAGAISVYAAQLHYSNGRFKIVGRYAP